MMGRPRRESVHAAASGAGKLSIGALARATGVPVETLRTWEQRYGFPLAERRASGHRTYRVSVIPRLRRIADLLARGHRAGAVVPATDAELARLSEATAAPARQVAPPASPSARTVEDLLAAVAGFDSKQLTAALWADWGRLGAVDFVGKTVAPLIDRAGRAWADGRLEIRHEHFLSERLADVMRSIRLPFDQTAAGPLVVCATLPGEAHALGLQMVALVLASAGLRVLYLGTEIPPPQVADVARELGARAVAVSVSAAADSATVKRHLGRLREALPRPVVLLVGGRGAPAVRGETVTVADFAELDGWARRLQPSQLHPHVGRSPR